MTLHILSSPESFTRCQPALQVDDVLLLTLDAVYLCLKPKELPANTHALKDDIEARGLSNHVGKLAVVDMAEFVALSTAHQHCLSW